MKSWNTTLHALITPKFPIQSSFRVPKLLQPRSHFRLGELQQALQCRTDEPNPNHRLLFARIRLIYIERGQGMFRVSLSGPCVNYKGTNRFPIA
ncbi:hypothetical protein CEXT_603381 [Caerostris extrusa]|uniref:Uncharacterized protein n=1 Tax=Caerostris extrusa TaxID=172846 RepID=A0AAV4N3Q8_CAEEX|nr:hypothetical protein CEXT_603381 [Caerostris extrusa]